MCPPRIVVHLADELYGYVLMLFYTLIVMLIAMIIYDVTCFTAVIRIIVVVVVVRIPAEHFWRESSKCISS